MKSNPRWIALQVLLQLLDRGRSLDDIFNSDWFQSLAAEKRDISLSRELVSGLCRWHGLLKPLLDSRMQKPLRARDLDIEVILLLGLYQLLVMKTDAHAAVNETVKLAQKQKKGWARGLINGVLRQLIRDRVEVDKADLAKAYPDWMLARIRRDWGDQADQALLAGNARAPMTLRVDIRQLSIEDSIQMLGKQDMTATPSDYVRSAAMLDAPCDVALLPGFASGKMSVQDAAAQIAAGLLDCVPGMHVLDACAAPGGKTAHLLQMTDSLELDALDQSETRLQRVQSNLQRIDKKAQLLVGDATDPTDWFNGEAYDRILADVPCSASGVIRRNPDIKLLRRESDIMPMLRQQRQILDALWGLLKPGGKMLYSTCSIFKDENEHQIGEFVESHNDCVELPITGVPWGEPRTHGRQILPGPHDMDGFYYALLQKDALN